MRSGWLPRRGELVGYQIEGTLRFSLLVQVALNLDFIGAERYVYSNVQLSNINAVHSLPPVVAVVTWGATGEEL